MFNRFYLSTGRRLLITNINLKLTTMEFTQEEVQQYFNTDIDTLLQQEENDIEYLEQNHFGDLLVEKTEVEKERFKLWRNLDENNAQGEPLIEVEYCGMHNGYTWQTVLTLERY